MAKAVCFFMTSLQGGLSQKERTWYTEKKKKGGRIWNGWIRYYLRKMWGVEKKSA